MTTKFCTACQATKPLEGGVVRKSKVTRWICEGCAAKKSRSPYQSSQKTTRAVWVQQ